jgi:hypothetical protein
MVEAESGKESDVEHRGVVFPVMEEARHCCTQALSPRLILLFFFFCFFPCPQYWV